ncbi:hypothetical protein VCUG_02177 [Vavraia culicis subsp. floridensis]|uniref:Protein YOP1 n=1 Tax=Vavraia culicis (isolate floridensis) TaxID=948595 RepID=L2GSJ3_VAVCU|nr:uncharacterized protein VCUG_02177 [Vavraia culicis subsp. floridensis]ELA46332.1 hypothetical protein VCUG_02177 [Vavraia culicis subsp. floridensis]
MDQLTQLASNFPVLRKLQQKTNNKVKQEHILLIVIALSIITIVFLPVASLVSNVLCVVIPFQRTVRLLIANKPPTLDLVVFWMTFGLLCVVDSALIVTRIVPFYYIFKMVAMNAIVLDGRVSRFLVDGYKRMGFLVEEDVGKRAKEAVEVLKEKSKHLKGELDEMKDK